MQTVTPMIAYRDGMAAVAWLERAFGFRPVRTMQDPSGRLAHAEMDVGDGSLVMLATPSPEYEGPRAHGSHCEAARRWLAVPYIVDGVLVLVADTDAHCARARAAGAIVLSEPQDSPVGRQYRVEDVEGHRWMFLAPAR